MSFHVAGRPGRAALKAIKYFGNAGCKFDNAADVPLSSVERHNIGAIKKVEKNKGCL